MERRILVPPSSFPPISYYSDGIHVGPVVYTAGQAALNGAGELVGEGNASEQAKLAFHHISNILKEGGMGLQDVVRLNLFLLKLSDFPAILAVKEEYFQGFNPTFTLTVVKGVALPGFLFELEAIASTGSN